tara:strand:- start:490 stop:834 length:345 start_codon:yes stop_codon:yes gene_type:complete
MNTSFAVSIYVGFYSNLDNMLSAFAAGYAYGTAWLTIIIGLVVGWLMYDEMVTQRRNSKSWKSNRIVDTIYDLCIIAAFVGVGTTFAYVTAILYVAHLIVYTSICSTAKKLNLT